jgi:ATP-dependent DNA ligase
VREPYRRTRRESLRQAAKLELEATVVKRAESPYVAGRFKDWLKIKTLSRKGYGRISFESAHVSVSPEDQLLSLRMLTTTPQLRRLMSCCRFASGCNSCAALPNEGLDKLDMAGFNPMPASGPLRP